MMRPRDSAARDDLLLTLINEGAEPKRVPLSLLEEITDFFSTDNLIGHGGFAKVYKGSIGSRKVAVKRLLPTLNLDEKGFIREIECLTKVKHKNIVRLLGFCYETQEEIMTCNEKPVIASQLERLLCFQYLPKGGLDKYITDSGLQWEQRYQIINGVCQGLHQLHEANILHLDLKPQNILLDDDNVPKIADFGLARCLQKGETRVHTKTVDGTLGYMAPEFIDSGLITKRCDLYSLGVIIMELLTGTRRQCAVNDVLDSWISRLGESKTKEQLEQIKECAQIAIECCSNPKAENRPPDTKHIIDRLEKVESAQGTQQSAGKLFLHVHPTFLVFELQPAGKSTPCLLHLTNDTDERMMFKLRTAESVHGCWSEQFFPRYGFVAARSTYTLVLTVSWEREIPEKRFCDMILESLPKRNSNSEAKEEVKLTAYLSTQHRQSTIPTATGQLGVTISWMEKPHTRLYSVDTHPTKPWIITGHERGRITIRNHDTQKLLYSFKVSRGPVHSVKFIARKQWFICATAAEGLAHVYSYETQEMQKINSFTVAEGLAHVYSYETRSRVCYHVDDETVICLAVHPSLPYVMSWCSKSINDEGIKLWDWDNGWECTRTFQISGKNVTQVAFDPKETNRFAAAIDVDPFDDDGVTIWSLDCPEPEYHLPLTDFMGISFLEFFTRDDQQYLIIANEYSEARVWDLQERKFAFEKRKSLSLEASVFSRHNLPLLTTLSSWNGTCRFWSVEDLSLYGVLNNFRGGEVQGIACLMGSKTRFVIGQSYALIVLDIQKATFQEDLQESTETKLCDVTRHAYTSSELITQGSSEIHHIHQLKADFSFEDDDLIPCLLHLTNKTDKHTAFMLSSTTEEQPFEVTPLNHGIVPSRSIYTLDYKMPKGEKKSNLILQSSIYRERYIYTFEDQSECDQFFEDAKETRNVVHEVVLEPVLSQKGETASENRSTGQDVTQRLIQIRGLCDPTTDNDVISSLDVNPAQSWIMTFHQNGNFFIRDIDTQEKIYLMSTKDDVYSVKIITRKQWVLVGTRDGFIHVYEYETGMTRIKRFKVGEPYSSDTDESGVLVVHPTLPYVLSTNGYKMKLWDWDKGWECIQTFENEAYMGQVAFSPEGTNTFATASSNHKIKLWSHSSPTAEYTLHGHEGRVNCLDFFRGDDVNQYLISGSEDCTTKIWDLQKKTCLHTLGVFLSPVTSVISLPDSPYMVTGSRDGTVHLWSSPSLRLERVLQIGCARPVRNLYLMGSKRVVIQKMNEISIMDIDASSKEPPELLLHVHPTTLVFELQPGKLSQCSLQLTNDTDQEMKFKLSSTESVDWSEQFLPRKGIVAARSTYTLILNVFLERDIAERRFCDMILKSCKFAERRYWDKLFDYQKTNNNVANEVKLRACLSSSQHRQSIVAPMPTGLGVRVSWMEKPRTRLLSVDAHPIRPWIITGHECGGVAIWNHDTQRLLCSSKVSRRGVYSVKFIWQKQWFICSSGEGFIHVYSYETQEIQKVNCFRAYDDNSRWLPISLAVHPSRPYVMSWCRYDREIMNLWDWDKGWDCTRTFRSGGGYVVDHVAFDPMETNRFVATDWLDGKVTIWSLDSPEPEYHLPETDFKGVMFLEFFTRYGRQYLIIADGDHKARVWDFRLREFVSRKRKLLSREASVFSRPNVPLLLTPSSRGTCRFWDAKKFSFYGVLDNSAGGDVQGIACLMGSKTRFVIGQYYALTILHLDNATYQKDPRQSIEPQLCAHTGQGDTSSEEKYGEEMVWRHGPDFDWQHEPFDAAIMRANVGEKAHGRYMLSDIMIDSTEVTAQRMSSLFYSLSLSSHQPNKQELEVARLCEELRQRDEHQKVQQDYFFSFIQQQHAIIQALSHQHGLDVVLPEFRLPLPPMLPQLSPFLSTLSQATSDASGTEPTGMAFVESFAYPPLGTDSEHNSNHPSSGFGA